MSTDMVAEDRPGTTDGRRRRSITLGEAFTEFTRWPSPRIITALLVTAIVARSLVAGWTMVECTPPRLAARTINVSAEMKRSVSA